jgi:transposase-like protein
MARREYTPEQRAACLAALAANGGNLAKTARQCGVPRMTLLDWTRDAEGRVTERPSPPPSPPKTPVALEAQELLPAATQALADATEEKARQLLGGLTPEKIKGMPGEKLMVAFGIAVDKMRLLRGEATSINESIDGAIERELEGLAGRGQGAPAGRAEAAGVPARPGAAAVGRGGQPRPVAGGGAGEPGDAPTLPLFPAGGQEPHRGGPGVA